MWVIREDWRARPGIRFAQFRYINGLLIRLFVLSHALLVGLGLAELLVRFTRPQVTMFPRDVTSPEYAYEFPLNTTIRNARGTLWSFTYTTNEIGRRGPFVPAAATYDIPNVVLLGDSFTFSFGVDDNDVYSAQLQRIVKNKWRVLNGGMPGWGIDSEIKWFFWTGLHYRPAAVLQFCHNDPWDSNTGVTAIVDGAFAFHPISMSSQEELGYLDYLRAFAQRLGDERIPSFFVSVAYHDESGYGYDLDRFPLTRAGVEQLEQQSLLRFVDLPLS